MKDKNYERAHDDNVKMFVSKVFWIAEEESVNNKLSDGEISAIFKHLSEYFCAIPRIEIFTKDEMEKRCQKQ